jgi:hypothetical protein
MRAATLVGLICFVQVACGFTTPAPVCPAAAELDLERPRLPLTATDSSALPNGLPTAAQALSRPAVQTAARCARCLRRRSSPCVPTPAADLADAVCCTDLAGVSPSRCACQRATRPRRLLLPKLRPRSRSRRLRLLITGGVLTSSRRHLPRCRFSLTIGLGVVFVVVKALAYFGIIESTH